MSNGDELCACMLSDVIDIDETEKIEDSLI